MTDFKSGESVRINDTESLLAGKSGTVEYQQPNGQVWVQVVGFPIEKVDPDKLIKLKVAHD
jgi:uncharacterized protein YndB with AHSA1/START domain